MNKFKQITLGLIIFSTILLGQGTTVIQTPFGPKEIPLPQDQQPPAAAPAQQTPQAPAAQPPAAAQGPTAVPGQQNQPPASPANSAAAAQPAPQQSTIPAQNDAAAGVAFHLVNQDIRQVIQIIGNELGLNYIIDPAVKGTVDINTSETLRRSDLLPILESVLKVNGVTMIKNGNFYQVVPANTASRQPVEVMDQRAATAPDDQVVMQIIRMKYVAASEMQKILAPFMTDAGNITAHEAGNIILLTDRRSNLRKLLQILDEFDTASFQGERIRLLTVKNNRARDVIEDLKTIFTGYGMSDKSAIRLIAIDRLNAILVVTPNAEVFPEVERWLATLDQPVVAAGNRNFVYNVKNGKAGDLQKVLAELYGLRGTVQQLAPGPLAGPSTAPAAQQSAAGYQTPATPQALPQPLANLAGATATPTSPIRIIADETHNALVIQATPQEYSEIVRTLEQLDVLRRQVLIDAQVYEIALDDSLAFGVTAALQSRGTLANPLTTASTAASAPNFAAQTFAFIGRNRELVAFLNASENRSKVKTLSAPSVLVSDNGTAQFEVGTEIPIPTSSSVTPVQTGGTNLFAQTIQYQETGVILQVKPQINESGNVTMDIMQEISQAGPNTVSAIVAPAIGKSAVTSTIVVQDGQTIALGGFIRENTDLERSRVPLVGRIPVLGVLFGSTTNSKTRTELIVLITPHVLKTHADADLATDELKTKLKEIKSLLK